MLEKNVYMYIKRKRKKKRVKVNVKYTCKVYVLTWINRRTEERRE